MKNTVKDGWHKIAGFDVYTENGYIKRGTKNNGQLPTYPYRSSRDGCWDLDQYMTPDTFRRKVKNGSAIMKVTY